MRTRHTVDRSELESTTLLELVFRLRDRADSDEELYGLAAQLVNSGAVRLCGIFAAFRIPPLR